MKVSKKAFNVINHQGFITGMEFVKEYIDYIPKGKDIKEAIQEEIERRKIISFINTTWR